MIFGLIATCYFGLFLPCGLIPGEPEPKPGLIASSPAPAARFVGTEACVHCHKGGHKFPTHAAAGKEYSIWVSSDPHSRAYNTLFSEQATSIANKLKLESPPHKSDRCLACHATHVSSGMKAPGSKLNPADGVGCESCHGGAENWLVPHKLADWPFWSASQKESTGFVNTDNFASRTRKCVECHVGSEGREVNHDLIAAGHPRLLFEMSAYQAMLPRHWSRAKDLARNSVSAESRLWLVGQVVGATAALDLLDQRASCSDSPWPEFSEYACASCHHDLFDQRWKDRIRSLGDSVGQPSWGTWHFSLLDQLSTQGSIDGLLDADVELKPLREEMQQSLPDRDKVAEDSNDLKNRLIQIADILSSRPVADSDTIEIANQLFGAGSDGNDLAWDGLTQRYLAAVALRQSLLDAQRMTGHFSGIDVDDSRKRLIAIRDSLRYIENYDGPGQLDSSRREAINQNFSAIFDQLGK